MADFLRQTSPSDPLPALVFTGSGAADSWDTASGSVVTSPPVVGAHLLLTSAADGSKTTLLLDASGAGTFTDLEPGDYTLILSKGPGSLSPTVGFSLASPSLKLMAGTVAYPVSVVADPATTAANNQDGNATAKPGARVAPTSLSSDVNPLDFSIVAADKIENTYNNSAYAGYYTGAQCRLYIGNLFIDELVALSYTLQSNNVPLYGYCSEFYDAIGRGRSIVQGQLTVNYVHQGYLYAAVQNFGRKQTAPVTPVETQAKQLAAALQTESSLRDQPSAVTATPRAATQQIVASSLNGLLQSSTAAMAKRAKQLIEGLPSKDAYTNPVYLHQTFDMRIEIGGGQAKTVRLLEQCKLSGNEQVVDQSGQVIAESYSFIARRLR